MTTATTGTGTITLGSAVSGYLTFALAGVTNGTVVSYGIKDGANSEVGTGTYTSSGTTLSRTVTVSTNSNSAINLSGTAEVYITARAEDIVTYSAPAWTVWTPTVTPGTGSFTTVSATGGYFAIGKLVNFSVTITITTAGTASGAMSIPLPIGTAARPAMAMVGETNVVGFSGYGRIASGATTIGVINKYDNTTFIGNGNVVTITGIYEQT
jgi:hypothetical protein